MAEEPKQDATDAQIGEQKETLWSRVKDFLRNQPTFGLTLLYLYITGVGIVYSAALYRRFGINIFDYSEITDFLLTAFKNPVAFLSAGLLAAMGTAVAALQARTMRRLRQLRHRLAEINAELDAVIEAQAQGESAEEKEAKESSAEIEKAIEETETHQRRRMVQWAIIIPLAIVLASFILPYYSASKTASSIKDGENPAVEVRYRSFSGSAGQVTEPGLELIGATQKAAFFYDVNDKRTIVIPQAQIVSIEVPD